MRWLRALRTCSYLTYLFVCHGRVRTSPSPQLPQRTLNVRCTTFVLLPGGAAAGGTLPHLFSFAGATYPALPVFPAPSTLLALLPSLHLCGRHRRLTPNTFPRRQCLSTHTYGLFYLYRHHTSYVGHSRWLALTDLNLCHTRLFTYLPLATPVRHALQPGVSFRLTRMPWFWFAA